MQASYRSNATRAEFCAFATALYESITGTPITERKSFVDTTDINVEKMGALGVVTGVGEDRFNPHGLLTREQAATMLSRLSAALGAPLPESASAFTDNSEISAWARTQVGQVQAAGIMQGVGNNTFDPDGSYTREQSIATILRLYNALQK